MLARNGLGLLAVAMLLGGASPALAQFRSRVKIVDAKIGLPPGRFSNEKDYNFQTAPVIKNGMWAPVTFRLEVLGETDSRLKVVVESFDGDESRTSVAWPLGQLLLNPAPQGPDDKFRARGSFIEPTELPYIAYVRLGSRSSDTALRIWTDDPGRTSSPVSEPFKFESLRVRDQSLFTVVSLGSNLQGFRLPEISGQNNNRGLRGGRVETARFDSVASMPDQWFGYDAADVVILATGRAPRQFLQELFDPEISKPYVSRREALLEWVRRGGKLIISAGKNANELLQMKAFTDLLPVTATGTERVATLDLGWSRGSSYQATLRMPKAADTFQIVKVAVNKERPPIYIMPPRPPAVGGLIPREDNSSPLITQSNYGLGKITFAAFDLDDEPASLMPEALGANFWDWMLRVGGADKAYDGNKGEKSMGYSNPAFSATESEDGMMAGLRAYLDSFDGVPVISFGWVALFILLYTLLIGPVEYLFLKKVLGRLELTWVTFPIIVLSVSAAAYFTAYAVKGKDMKINKVDVVDFDLGTGRAYGRTWFTIFSPRTASYTLAVEPKEPWIATPDAADVKPAALMDWMSGKVSQGSFARSFSDYQYKLDHTPVNAYANGLEGVTIQVWSTKAFAGQWSGYLDKANPPIVSTVAHPASNFERASGNVTVNLPLSEMAEAAFVYRGQFQKLPALPIGTPIAFSSRETDDLTLRSSLLRVEPWVYANDNSAGNVSYGPVRRTPATQASTAVSNTGPISLWSLLFHEAAVSLDGRGIQNSSLRSLDQSWRLSKENYDELILLVKLNHANGLAEPILSDRESISPTKLWLAGRPTDERPRVPVAGTLRQETYVRFFIPVKRAGK